MLKLGRKSVATAAWYLELESALIGVHLDKLLLPSQDATAFVQGCVSTNLL